MRLKKYFLILVAVLYCADIWAIPVRHHQTTLTQPDGYTVIVQNIGDEWLHVSMTLDGAAVVKGEDGWFCYARFDANGNRHSTGVHIAPGADPSVVSEARAIPWETLQYRAAARRALQPSAAWNARPNIIRRLNVQHPVTKDAGSPITKHGIIILAEFSDVPFKYTKADFENLINGNGSSTAIAYFNDQFGGKYDFKFDIYGPVPLPKEQKYYGENDSSGDDKHPEKMIIDACEKLKTTVDFSKYDDDNDGEIDNVFVFFSGKDEADDETANADCIWSHQWYVKDGAGEQYQYNGKWLNSYACTSELMLSSSTGTYTMASIGTFCHEYTHTFGVPDFYDANYSGTGGTADGWWLSLGLMCAANMNNDGFTPPNYNAVERMELGLSEPVVLTEGSYSLEPIQKNGLYYIVNGDYDGEYYLIENRNQKGWDQYLPNTGLLIYHVDKSTRKTGVDDNGLSCTALERWQSLNRVNAWPAHQCADLVEADISLVGKYASASSVNALRQMEKRAFWPYNNVKAFSAYSSPAFTFWSGAASPLSITDIARSGDNVTFKVIGSGEVVTPPSVQNVTKNVFQDAAFIAWEASDAEFMEQGYLRYGSKDIAVEPYEPGKYAFWIEGLTPSTAYTVRLWFNMNGIDGKVDESTKFTTASVKKHTYPYIWLDSAARTTDGQFIAGAKIPLRVWNATDAAEIKWTFNGSSIPRGKDGWYEVKRSGVLSAEVVWEDGTSDVVTKKIVVR